MMINPCTTRIVSSETSVIGYGNNGDDTLGCCWIVLQWMMPGMKLLLYLWLLLVVLMLLDLLLILVHDEDQGNIIPLMASMFSSGLSGLYDNFPPLMASFFFSEFCLMRYTTPRATLSWTAYTEDILPQVVVINTLVYFFVIVAYTLRKFAKTKQFPQRSQRMSFGNVLKMVLDTDKEITKEIADTFFPFFRYQENRPWKILSPEHTEHLENSEPCVYIRKLLKKQCADIRSGLKKQCADIRSGLVLVRGVLVDVRDVLVLVSEVWLFTIASFSISLLRAALLSLPRATDDDEASLRAKQEAKNEIPTVAEPLTLDLESIFGTNPMNSSSNNNNNNDHDDDE